MLDLVIPDQCDIKKNAQAFAKCLISSEIVFFVVVYIKFTLVLHIIIKFVKINSSFKRKEKLFFFAFLLKQFYLPLFFYLSKKKRLIVTNVMVLHVHIHTSPSHLSAHKVNLQSNTICFLTYSTCVESCFNLPDNISEVVCSYLLGVLDI